MDVTLPLYNLTNTVNDESQAREKFHGLLNFIQMHAGKNQILPIL